MSSNIELAAKIASFAKSSKVSRSKLQAFVDEVVADVLSQAPIKHYEKLGRKATDQSLAFREFVLSNRQSLSGSPMTYGQIAEKANANGHNVCQATACNNLKWLAKNGKIGYNVVGKKANAPGQKGKAQHLFVIS